MPELPEVETIVQGLRTTIMGQTILKVEVVREDLLATPRGAFVRSLTGGSVLDIARRGKNIVFSIGANGDASAIFVVNLGMSGRLLRTESGRTSALVTHPGARFRLGDGSTLVYHDIRRFGRLTATTPEEHESWSASLGPEPLSSHFTRGVLAEALRRSASKVHPWLLHQGNVAGVGNIYASEALFRAGVHPQKRARDLEAAETRRLHRGIRAVLTEAVERGGTTLRDYRTFEGEEGSYAHELRVYARAGQPCTRCAGQVERVVLGGRSAFFCPECQPPPDEAS